MKENVYYIAQPIKHFKDIKENNPIGEYYTLKENWDEAFNFAVYTILDLVRKNKIAFSPALFTIPFGFELLKDKHVGYDRDLYIKMDELTIKGLRATGKLVFAFHEKWYLSQGCIMEFTDALQHGEKCIRLEPLVHAGKEVELKPYQGKSEEEEKVLKQLYTKFYGGEFEFKNNTNE
jgi:hypothetical protein